MEPVTLLPKKGGAKGVKHGHSRRCGSREMGASQITMMKSGTQLGVCLEGKTNGKSLRVLTGTTILHRKKNKGP